MQSLLSALLICVGAAALEGVCAGRDPMSKLRALRQPSWSPRPHVWILIGVFWYAICFTALARFFDRDVSATLIALVTGLMGANALANVPQFRWARLDIAFFYLFPYWVLLAIFLWRVRTADRVVFTLFAIYTVYQAYAGVWAWKLWHLNRSPD